MRFLMTTDTVGGVWTFTKELATEILRRGHHLALVPVGPALSAEQETFVSACRTRFTDAFCFETSSAPLEWMRENASAFASPKPLLMNLCREFQPDALLLNQFCFGALPVSQPKIVAAHSDVLSWADALGKSPLAEDPWLRTYRKLAQQGLQDADAVVAPTRSMLHALGRGFHIPCESAVIPNGRSVCMPRKPPVRKLQAITAGRLWDEAKNVRMLQEVSAAMPISVAGDIGDGIPDTVTNLHCLGKLTESNLFHHFHSSAIYICTSLYEPFGLASLEAAMCGCAVLANDIPSLREVWGDGALYFRDAASLSSLLHCLSAHPKQLADSQTRSSRRAAQYTATRMADGYLALATQLIAQQGRAAHAA